MDRGVGAWLVVIATPDPTLLGKRVPIGRELRVGRDLGCDISLDSPELLPHHASVKRFGKNAFEIEAAHPEAEVHVDDRPTRFSALQPGVEIGVGPLWLRLVAGEDAEALYHSEIYRLTMTDGLTGVHNARYLNEALEREILRARRYGRPLAVAGLKVEGLSAINRTSVADGDRILRAVGKSLTSLSPDTFIVARLSGVEFAIVMPEIEPKIARARVTELVEQVTKTVAGITLAWATTALEPSDRNAGTLLARVQSG